MTKSKYIKTVTSPLKFKLWALLKLPSANFWGLRVKSLSEERCEVSLPYQWSTKNPFKSIYFAALAGAGELATGALGQLALAERGSFAMLVVDFRAEFLKKANQKIVFSCEQGAELNQMLDKLENPGDSNQITLIAIGKNPEGEIVAKMFVTWSYKRRK
jgi:acyl-coenzyme A thioesterase PaaI-like protein